MARIKHNFDLIAPYYDLLVRLTFGNSLWKAQRRHLGNIKNGDKVLILGGGTGQILDWLPKEVEVTYVELSNAMMKRAIYRRSAKFVLSDFLTFSTEEKFDWIICPFFLDCFDDESLQLVMKKIYLHLHERGGMIVVDFKIENRAHKTMIKAMILFFRLVTKLEADRLLPIRQLLTEKNFDLIESDEFRKGFIFSDLYRKGKPFNQ